MGGKLTNGRQIETDRCDESKISIKKKLKGPLYWYHGKLSRQLPIVAAEFDADTLRGALGDTKVENPIMDDELRIAVGPIETEM